MDVREKLEVIAHLGDHITYKEDIGIFYDSALAKVIEDAYMELKNGVTVQDNKEITDELLKQLRNAPVTILQEEPTIEVVQKWISVKDRLPEKWQDIIAYDAKNQEIHLAYMTEDAWVGVRMNGKVTHWMPLPEPPKGE